MNRRIVCDHSMVVYAWNKNKRITVCEDGYLIATTMRDPNDNVTYYEEFVEGGFFSKSSMEEIFKELGLYVDEVQGNSKLMKLIERDIEIYG